MFNIHAGVLVRALGMVLVSKSLTDDDKRHVASLLDDEITAVITSADESPEELAKLAVKQATKKLRRSQGVASRTSLRREQFRRIFSSSTNAP
jgi:hypothetical protein